MIMPCNLPDIDDKAYKNICIKHINAGLLKGVDLALADYKTADDEYTYFKQFFPRGVYSGFVEELYRIRDIITSKMLYLAGDYDKYVIMCLLNNYYRDNVRDYNLKDANTFALHEKDNLKELSKSMNFHVITKQKDRDYVIAKFSAYASEIDSSVEYLMSTIEDFNQYINTCFADFDFLNFGDFTIEEMKALSTMHEYINLGIEIQETRLHKPYAVIK